MGPALAGWMSRRRGAASLQRASIGCLVAVALAGCGTTAPVRPGAEDPDNVTRAINLSGFPPEFRRGFTDGCTAARAGESGVPSEASGQYRVGWRDGFDYCSPQKLN